MKEELELNDYEKAALEYQYKAPAIIEFVINRMVYPIFSVMWEVIYKVAGSEKRPVFYDVDKTCPNLSRLTENHEVIKQELEALLPERDKLPRYFEISMDEQYTSGGDDPNVNWKVFMLTCMDNVAEDNRAKCPKTSALLAEVPDVCQAFFSILDPRKSIPPHNTFGLTYLRYHLGLKIPKVNPPFIEVKGNKYVWKEGEAMMFDHSQQHHVVNECDEIRVIMIVDILRPLPVFLRPINSVVHLFAKKSYGRRIIYNLEQFTKRKGEQLEKAAR